jgi:hypothetical protein
MDNSQTTLTPTDSLSQVVVLDEYYGEMEPPGIELDSSVIDQDLPDDKVDTSDLFAGVPPPPALPFKKAPGYFLDVTSSRESIANAKRHFKVFLNPLSELMYLERHT